MTGVEHKVRATLGKNRATVPGEKVLVGCSGGKGSSCLASLLQGGTTAATKRMLFLPYLLFIEEGAVLGVAKEDRLQRVARARKALGSYGFPVHITFLEYFLSPSSLRVFGAAEEVEVPCSLATPLHQLFGGLGEGTGKQELLSIIRRELLTLSAGVLGCSKVLTGESREHTAVELLTGVATGAGGSLAD